jgi:hypothetical protein
LVKVQSGSFQSPIGFPQEKWARDRLGRRSLAHPEC